jgi:hypothetical protein
MTLVCYRPGRGGPADSEWACCSVGAGGWTHRRVISCGLGCQHRVECRWSAGVRWLRQAHHRTLPAQGKVADFANKYSAPSQNAIGSKGWGKACPRFWSRNFLHLITNSKVSSTYLKWESQFIVGAFVKLRKATGSFVASICLSVQPFVRMEQMGSHWTDFHEIWYMKFFENLLEKNQV